MNSPKNNLHSIEIIESIHKSRARNLLETIMFQNLQQNIKMPVLANVREE
jgi:hypothetical protein